MGEDKLPEHLREWLKDPDRCKRARRAVDKTELLELALLIGTCMVLIPALMWFVVYCITN